MPTAIDWSKKPPPWDLIGPAFRAEVEAILGRRSAPPAEKLPDLGGLQFTARLVRAKLSQSELARRAGCSSSAIQNLAAGTGSISRELWARVDAALTAAERDRAA